MKRSLTIGFPIDSKASQIWVPIGAVTVVIYYLSDERTVGSAQVNGLSLLDAVVLADCCRMWPQLPRAVRSSGT